MSEQEPGAGLRLFRELREGPLLLFFLYAFLALAIISVVVALAIISVVVVVVVTWGKPVPCVDYVPGPNQIPPCWRDHRTTFTVDHGVAVCMCPR